MGRGRTGWHGKKPKKAAPGDATDKYQNEPRRADQEERGWRKIVHENAAFTKYYQANDIAPGEWEAFHEILKVPLPSTFRIAGNDAEASYMATLLKTRFFDKMDIGARRPAPVPWLPTDRVWVSEASRREIRSDDVFSDFHRFLVQETEEGNLLRQELVSMIPPLLLDVHPGMKVLDMCAAPGSKTAQIIEAVHGNGTEIPRGIVIANDMDPKRCHMLVHQTQRLQSPCCLVTAHDASAFPQLYFDATTPGEPGTPLQFDRVLCDAPCSGDGTMRKNPLIWMSWNPNSALGLHRVQYKILYRGCQLLRIGGRIVYSTCSFNPIENEAVVAALLRDTKGALRLVDVSDQLPLLKREPGRSTWKVMNKNQDIYESVDQVPEASRHIVLNSMFPPTADEAQSMHLERCVRILPHRQNTGGFFIAVFEKVGAVGAIDRQLLARAAGVAAPVEADPVADEDKATAAVEPTEASASGSTGRDGPRQEGPRKRQRTIRNDDPFSLLDPTGPEVACLSETFGLVNFPYHQLVNRAESERKRNLSLVSDDVYRLLRPNIVDKPLKIVNMGVKLFARQDGARMEGRDAYRIMQSGLIMVRDHFGPKAIHLPREDLLKLLSEEFVAFDRMTVGPQLHALPYGCVVLAADVTNAEGQVISFIALAGWRGKHLAHVLVNRKEKLSILWRLDPDIAARLTKAPPPSAQRAAKDAAGHDFSSSEEDKEAEAKDDEEGGEEADDDDDSEMAA